MDSARERRIRELMEQRGLRAGAPTTPAWAALTRRTRTQGPPAPGQQRLWLLDRLHPGTSQYNVPMAWRIEGPLDEDALVDSLRRLGERHEALRTVFREAADGRLEQVVVDRPLIVETVDLSMLPPSGRDASADARIHEDAVTPFDLTAGPLVRLRLYRHGNQRWTFSATIHHIVFDDWSSGVLQQDVTALYRAAVTGAAADLPPLPVQYLDWVLWEQGRAETVVDRLDYWHGRLDGARPALDLPVRTATEREPGPAVQVTVPVAPADLKALEHLGKAEGCTPYMVVLAAWAALLHRCTDQDDLVIGTPFAQRGPVETHGLIGFFLNTLAVRLDLAGAPDFRTLLARVRGTTTEAYDHADVPFDAVVQALSPERSGSRHPLFQAWFAADEVGSTAFDLAGASCTPLQLDGDQAKFDLALFASRGADAGTDLVIEYDGALFESATVGQLARQLARLIGLLAAEPDLPLSAHDLLDPQETEQVLYTWNDTAAELSAEPLVHHWFERQVERTPDSVAAECGEEHITYGDLDRRAAAITQALVLAGVGTGAYVGIAVQRSLGMLAAVLGVLKAGAAYVPVDLSHPQERIGLVLEDTAASVILVDAAGREALPPTGATLIDLAELPGVPEPGGPEPDGAAAPDPVAYVTYTSGSTGRPKGILMPHRAVSNLVAWQLRRYAPWQPGYRTLQFASLSFDVSFQEIFSTLGAGGTLVLITEEQRRDVHGLADLLNRLRIQRLFIPAVALQQVAEGYRAGGSLPRTLDTVVAGSEQLVAGEDLRRLLGDLPRCRLHNEYGPSETHVTTAYTLPEDPADWPAWVPIGRPVANTRVYVLDSRRRPVAPGMRGEVYIGGVGLAHGYLDRPDLTKAAFVPDPFSPEPGARLYRTGDIARHLRNGELEFLGRADGQVKIRGFRVELGEVQAGIDAHPLIRSAFIRVHGERSAERRLVAYLVPAAGSSPEPGELRRFLRRRLPEYMVPSAFMVLDRFPLTVNGKVDQRRLPEPVFGITAAEDVHEAPADEVESEIARVMADLLGLERVGRAQDFFALGGHSLLATKMLWTVRSRFSAELALGDFYQQPTVAGLADQVRTALASPVAPPTRTAPDEQQAKQRLDDLFDELLGPAT